jgi:hypothetical protein
MKGEYFLKFSKSNGNYQDFFFRCDSVIHCTDGSDEDNCKEMACLTHFQCSDGSCLARNLVCGK